MGCCDIGIASTRWLGGRGRTMGESSHEVVVAEEKQRPRHNAGVGPVELGGFLMYVGTHADS